MIKCITVDGDKKFVHKKELAFRPSVYGVIMSGDKILFVKTYGKYYLPGGGMEVDETTQQAVVRKIKEELDLDISVGKFLSFNETFFYHELVGGAVHKLNFYYLCKLKTVDLTAAKKKIQSDPEIEEVAWVKLDELPNINYGGSLTNLLEVLNS